MKKIRYTLATLMVAAIVAVVCVGCKKEKETQQNGQNSEQSSFVNFKGFNVKVQENDGRLGLRGGNWLYFQTREDYENAIEVLADDVNNGGDVSFMESSLGFNSMRSSLTESQREAIEMEDDVFSTLLSPNGIVQIGNYLFQIDELNDVVLMYDVTNDTNNPMRFNTEDDVFSILDGEQDQNKGNACSGAKQTYKWSSSHEIECTVRYFKGGIYFALFSKINKKTCISGGEYISMAVVGDTYTRNRKKAQRERIAYYFKDGHSGSYSHYSYSKMCGLKQYDMTVSFYYENGIEHDCHDITITCH